VLRDLAFNRNSGENVPTQKQQNRRTSFDHANTIIAEMIITVNTTQHQSDPPTVRWRAAKDGLRWIGLTISYLEKEFRCKRARGTALHLLYAKEAQCEGLVSHPD
jgi:hypothetical protein